MFSNDGTWNGMFVGDTKKGVFSNDGTWNDGYNGSQCYSGVYMDGFICREGTLKVGDRILMINAVNGSQKSLSDAFLLLARPQSNVHLLVEYDVSVMGECVIYVLLVCI